MEDNPCSVSVFEPTRHALTPAGSYSKSGRYTRLGSICKALCNEANAHDDPAIQLPIDPLFDLDFSMLLSRPTLHRARVAIAVLFWPSLALVIWASLVFSPSPQSIWALVFKI